MPTYEFRCPQGHEFEKFYRTISGAESTAACPDCGQVSERMMSATGFAFKGSGFYLTDYGKNAHRDKGTPTPATAGSGDGAGKGEPSRSDGGAKETSKGESGGSSGDTAGGKTSDKGAGSSSGGETAKPAAAESKASSAPAPKKSPGE